MLISTAIFVLLGAGHLAFTFYGSKLEPRDPSLQRLMKEVSPGITKTTTMWRCWMGFNASHGLGAIAFGLTYGYLAVAHESVLFGSPYLLIMGFVMIFSFVVLAKLYWFRTPFICTAVSLACYLASILAT